MARQNVTDEPTSGPESDPGTGWLSGYQASDPKDADTKFSNKTYVAPCENAVGYKKMWDKRPSVFPNGEGDDGSL